MYRRRDRIPIYFGETCSLQQTKVQDIIMMSESVCPSVENHPACRTSPTFVHADRGCGSVFLCRRLDRPTLRTTGFAGDVMFSYSGLYGVSCRPCACL